MRIAGHNRVVDSTKLGTGLLIAACVVLAVRTARWPARSCKSTSSDHDLDAEVDHAIYLAQRVLAHLLSRAAGMFPHRDEPWFEATDEDSPK